MKIFLEVKDLVKREKAYTKTILEKLMVIERDKLYSDLKYPSLHKYLVRELRYSDAEAALRVSATRLMMSSKTAKKKIQNGELSITKAAKAHQSLKQVDQKIDQKTIEEVVELASTTTEREFKNSFAKKFSQKRREVLNLDEHMIANFDKLRKKYGDLSTYELIQILLEKELKTPAAPKRYKIVAPKNSRYVPRAIKYKVYQGQCENCGVKYGLEYHHKKKYSHGGDNSAQNIGVLCKSCNMREELKIQKFFI